MNVVQEDALAWKGVMDALRVYVATAQQRGQWSRLIEKTGFEYGRHEYAMAVADDVAGMVEDMINEITEEVQS